MCHSFWVPRLAGKTDLIPGQTNQMWFQTREHGLFLGQCAEYCGTQHANMLLRVVVDTPEEFEQLAGKPARSRHVDDPEAAGRQDRPFWRSRASIATGCAARRRPGTYAPDLTHLMSRANAGLGHGPEHAGESASAGSPTRSRSSPAA